MTKFVADPSGVQAIADALRVSPSLTELSISGNLIGDDGKYAIGAAVGSSMRRLVCDKLDLRADATEPNLRKKDLGPGDAALIAGGLRAFMGSLTSVWSPAHETRAPMCSAFAFASVAYVCVCVCLPCTAQSVG